MGPSRGLGGQQMVAMGRTSVEGYVQRKVVSEASPVGEVHRGRGHHCDLVGLREVNWETFQVIVGWGDRGDVAVEAQWEDLAAEDLWMVPLAQDLHSGS